MSTYLELVNKAIVESGVDLTELTSGTWDDTTGKRMYDRFKGWVKDAWTEIQIERNEWEFKAKHLTTSIRPRIYVELGNRAGGAPPVGSIFIGQTSGYRLEVTAVTTDTGVWTAGTATAIVEFEVLEGNMDAVIGEMFDEESPAAAIDVFQYNFWGRYDFVTDIGAEASIDPQSFTIVGSSQDGSNLKYVPWSVWRQNYESSTRYRGRPYVVTITNDGKVDFYPRPDVAYTITFGYASVPQVLSADDDEPLLDQFYNDMIAWRAVIFYALWDKNMDVLNYAKARHAFFKGRMERNMMPEVTFAPSTYDE